MNDFRYAGSELDLFADALNWKSYWSGQIRPFLAGAVLEVGAGIGSNTGFLDTGGIGRWLCLEPDPQLAARLEQKLRESKNRNYEVLCGTLQAIGAQQFDSIVYIDVLEHIENDREELDAAASHLRRGGRLIVLSPAHQSLFSPFDAAIGHFRRYNSQQLRAAAPPSLNLERIRYLDCVGLLASAANLLVLRQSIPTEAQLSCWNRRIVPLSAILDRLFRYKVGKSILAVWQKP